MNSTLEGLLFLEGEGTRRTREGHWEQKVHLTKKDALFLHDLRPVLEKKSPLQELLRHKPQELEKCVPWQ